jgi:hypothetical protein
LGLRAWPVLTQRGGVLVTVKDAVRRASARWAFRPSLTATARGALAGVWPGRRNGRFQPNQETRRSG